MTYISASALYNCTGLNADSLKIKQSDNIKLLFSNRLGYSYRTSPISSSVPDEWIDYVAKLRHGISYGSDLVLYLNKTIGLGLSANISYNVNNKDLSTFANEKYPRIKDEILIKYYGGIFDVKFESSNEKVLFHIFSSIGIMEYINYSHILITKSLKTTNTIYGNTIGSNIGCGLIFIVNKKLAIPLRFSYFMGSIKDLKIKGILTPTYIHNIERKGLNTIDFSFGVTYYY